MELMADTEEPARAFKTAWFAKAARKALINDEELCEAIAEVRLGQADDLGGGVFKKRLDKNRSRSIVLAKDGATGFTPTSLRRRTGRTSTMTN
jgi:hypothetical protein